MLMLEVRDQTEEFWGQLEGLSQRDPRFSIALQCFDATEGPMPGE
ncbi:hypothetical protein [Corallococcus exercitus]|nr:hypothetical protein [Corallococcus exercitus]